MADSDEEEFGESFFNKGESFTYFHPLSSRKHFRFNDPCNDTCIVQPMCKRWCDERYKYRNWECWKSDLKYYTKKAFRRFILKPIKVVWYFTSIVAISITGSYLIVYILYWLDSKI